MSVNKENGEGIKDNADEIKDNADENDEDHFLISEHTFHNCCLDEGEMTSLVTPPNADEWKDCTSTSNPTLF